MDKVYTILLFLWGSLLVIGVTAHTHKDYEEQNTLYKQRGDVVLDKLDVMIHTLKEMNADIKSVNEMLLTELSEEDVNPYPYP